MTQVQLNRAVAAATGESIELIEAHGFQHHTLPSRGSIRWAERLLRFRQQARRRKGRMTTVPSTAA